MRSVGKFPMPPKKPPAPSARHRVAAPPLTAIERDRLQRRIDELADAVRHFTFPSSPDAFQSTDGGCTKVLVVDEHVRQARRAVGAAYNALARRTAPGRRKRAERS